MSLDVENPETCRLADELARLTGETKTGAITVALRERLEREQRRRNVEIRQQPQSASVKPATSIRARSATAAAVICFAHGFPRRRHRPGAPDLGGAGSHPPAGGDRGRHRASPKRSSSTCCRGDAMSETAFLRPRLIGKRFDGHAIPLEVLKDLAVLEDLIVEVAKLEFRKDHPHRRRSPRGFTEGITLKLTGVEGGSAVPLIELCPDPETSPLPENRRYFERARDTVIRAIAAAERGGNVTNVLPEKMLTYFDRIGRSLKNDEKMAFAAPGQDVSAELTRETRRRLVLASSNITELTDDVSVRGAVPAIDQDAMAIQIQLSDGRKIKAPLAPRHLDVTLEAVNGYKDSVRILFQGVGRFDRGGRLLGFESIEHMGLVDPLDVSAQLDDLRRLEDGWLDGHGTAPASGGLDWLDRAFNRHYPDDLPLPHLYPTAPGGVQAEWTLGPNEITLEMDLDRRSGYFHVLHVEDDAGEERNIELGGESGWKELAGLISSMSQGGR